MDNEITDLDEKITRINEDLNYCENLIYENPFSACRYLADASFASEEVIQSYEGWIKMKGKEFSKRVKAVKSRTRWLQERAYQAYLI